MSHIIGIDIGTSGIKVGAMNREGGLDCLEYQSYSLLFPGPGLVEIDLEDVWLKTKRLLLKVCSQVGRLGSVDAVSLSTFCNCSVFMNEKGEAISPGIMYFDQRSKKETDWIKKAVGEDRIFEITKNRIEPGMYTITTLLWYKNNRPDLYEKMFKCGNLSTYILNKLTGAFVMDWTQSSYTGMYDLENYEWSSEIIAKAGIDKEKLPNVVDPASVAGKLMLADIPSADDIPVIAGAADTACSTIALGVCIDEMFESVGTSNVLTVCTDQPDSLDNRFLNRCHVIKDCWLSHGAMSFPGASIQWFYDQFLKSEGHSKDILDDLCQQSQIGAGGVFFLPYMLGERSPIWDKDARGVFIGIHLNTSKADMFRAILEGCSFGLKQIYEIIETNYKLPIDSFPSIGGGAKNKEWASIKSNVLNKKIYLKDITETAVLGTCLIAGKTIGYYTSFEEAANTVSNSTICTIAPSYSQLRKYEELYQVFNQLYPSLKSFFALASNSRRAHNSLEELV